MTRAISLCLLLETPFRNVINEALEDQPSKVVLRSTRVFKKLVFEVYVPFSCLIRGVWAGKRQGGGGKLYRGILPRPRPDSWYIQTGMSSQTLPQARFGGLRKFLDWPESQMPTICL